MLYVTTREKFDASTTPWVLKSDTGADGGRYLPFRIPTLSQEDLLQLQDKPFGQAVADILNLFFGTRLSGWDVEFTIGRHPVKIVSPGQKILVCECWRNLDGSYEKLEKNLGARICGCSARDVRLTSWMRIGIRIAALAGILGELQRQQITQKLDVAVPAGDLTLLMAVLYGKKMGMPFGVTVCGTSGSDGVWDLVQMGQLRTLGGVPEELERLIHHIFGVDETMRYLARCELGEIYTLLPEQGRALRAELFAAVVSQERVLGAIPRVHGTSGYLLGLDAAIAYSALMDYLAVSGERRMTLILSDKNPADDAAKIAAAMNLSESKLKELLH